MKKWAAGLILVTAVVLIGLSHPIFAQSPKSANFRFEELSVGGNSLYGSSSTSFQAAQSSIGVLGVGDAASDNFQIIPGEQTSGDPSLSFTVNSSSVNFGTFSSVSTAVATSTFEVVNYTSYGYVVQIIGTPPTNGSHVIEGLGDTEPSQVGVEQFGINLVANVSPESLGANPDQGQFGFGEATPNYATSDEYRFVSGETIAMAPKSSGKTVFTISYIINVGSLTPGGRYEGNHTIICTGTY